MTENDTPNAQKTSAFSAWPWPMMASQRDPLEILEQASWHRQKEAELRSHSPSQADFHGARALDLEAQAQAHHVRQPTPVCPYCFDIDDADQHDFIGDGEGGAMIVQCICGQAYLAKVEKITAWTTKKYP